MGTANLHGLNDRGRLGAGYRADVNLIDFDALGLDSPRIAFDLPTGARRLIQGATGYRATLKTGIPIFENGEATDVFPGSLLRGPQTL